MTGGRSPVLWAAAVAAPLAWFVQLTVGYGLVPPAHVDRRDGALVALSAGCLAVALIAAVIGLIRRRSTLGAAALVLGLGFALLIAGTSLPLWLLGAGAEP